jgi:hypothetical protein
VLPPYPIRTHVLLVHASRQAASWLIFDVRRTCSEHMMYRGTRNGCSAVLFLLFCSGASAHPPYVAPRGPLTVLGLVALLTIAGWLVFGRVESKIVRTLLFVFTFAAVVLAGLALAVILLFSSS